MDVINAIAPSLFVSHVSGAATFNANLNRTYKKSLVAWSLFVLNFMLQVSDWYYFITPEVQGNIKIVTEIHPHDSTLITFNCLCTTFLILIHDGMICKHLINLREFNRKWFTINQVRLRKLNLFCKLLSRSCVSFCVLFVSSILVSWWIMVGTRDSVYYIIHCVVLFVRFAGYAVLSNQVVTYYMLMGLWYDGMRDCARQLKVGSINKEHKRRIKLLAEADMLIKDFNGDLEFLYSIFNLLSCTVVFLESIHAAVHIFLNLYTEDYKLVIMISIVFVTAIISQICFFISTSTLASKKEEKTAQYIQEFVIDCDDMEVKEEVQLLALQLFHRKLEFTAFGFFNMDFSLLYGMGGTIVTYILVLLQFQSSPNKRSS